VLVAGIKITNSDRVIFANGTSKGDVAQYVERVAPLMLPHVRGRPITVVRSRDGAAAFFQKHDMKGMPSSIDVITVVDKSGPTKCLSVHDAAGLVGLVQMSALEFHVWGSKENDHETPDRLVFDLDPGEDVEWREIVAAARHVRGLLLADSLTSFVKTTGGKGLHVVAPVDAKSWSEVAAYAERLALQMIDDKPDSYTTNMKKAVRQGRIFLDFGRNWRGATSVAPYSPRVRSGDVSMPVSWDELDDVRGSTFTMKDTKSAWPDYFAVRQTLPR
jgi:bifunctional non-homologous end joining protein LigD